MSNLKKVKANKRQALVTKLNKKHGFKESGLEIPTEINESESGYVHVLILDTSFDTRSGEATYKMRTDMYNPNFFDKMNKANTFKLTIDNDANGKTMHVLHDPRAKKETAKDA